MNPPTLMFFRIFAGLSLVLFLTCCADRGSQKAAAPAIAAPKPEPGVFYVATNGNDSWSGNLPVAGARNEGGPFATLGKALEAARDWKRQQGSNSQKPAAIFLRGGTYALKRPLVLVPSDSDLLIAAY